MSLDKTHNRPKNERFSKSFFAGKRVHGRNYQYVEDLLCLIVVDIINGVPRSDIIKKLTEQLYEGQRQKYTEGTAFNYYAAAMRRIKFDREESIDDLKDKLYSQYYQLYADAMQDGNTMVAKSVLDSIAKTFLSDSKSVNIVGADSNKITISFGFNNNNDL